MNKIENIGAKVKADWKLSQFEALLVKETEKAILLDLSFDYATKEEIWVPKSLVKEVHELEDCLVGWACEFVMPTWWVIQSGRQFVREIAL